MKTHIERRLEQIRDIGEQNNLWLSCDIYYDDLAVNREEQFVVKVHSKITHINEHFRSNHIRKSLRMAVKWLKEYEAGR